MASKFFFKSLNVLIRISLKGVLFKSRLFFKKRKGMSWRMISIFSIVLALGIATWWIADGMQVYSKDQRKEVVKVKDEIFGTETETVKYVDDFQLGLLPHALPAIGGLTLVALYGLFKARRRASLL